eukprot:TRINITY_DN21530_c0_g1_i2.p1 TRINITY_DN21530_c0_g1~~TRINITY_DN21530_c0_g1_i2.p1  ORF type:complete len:499 (+),score=160.65 TRINITY_DN21530_c0_g1_i2:75-1571(+)
MLELSPRQSVGSVETAGSSKDGRRRRRRVSKKTKDGAKAEGKLEEKPRTEPISEEQFVERMLAKDTFWKTMGRLAESCNMALGELQAPLAEFCRCCWQEAQAAIDLGGELAAARRQVESLGRQNAACHASYLKELDALRNRSRQSDELEADKVTFHEPLKYLDESSKELVLRIVIDKLRQLEEGAATDALVKDLREYVERATSESEACKETERQRQGRQAAEEELAKAQAASLLQKAKLEAADRASAEAQAIKDRLQRELAEAHAFRKEQADQLRLLSKEKRALQAELDRRNDTKTQCVQTAMTGREIKEQVQERQRLKQTIEERRERLDRILAGAKMLVGGGQMLARRLGCCAHYRKLAQDAGLEDLLEEGPVFQRLHDDAMENDRYFEFLRGKLEKRGGGLLAAVEMELLGPPVSPEPPVADSNDLPCMRNATSLPALSPVRQSAAAAAAALAASAAARQAEVADGRRNRRARQEPAVPRPRMRLGLWQETSSRPY